MKRRATSRKRPLPRAASPPVRRRASEPWPRGVNTKVSRRANTPSKPMALAVFALATCRTRARFWPCRQASTLSRQPASRKSTRPRSRHCSLCHAVRSSYCCLDAANFCSLFFYFWIFIEFFI